MVIWLADKEPASAQSGVGCGFARKVQSVTAGIVFGLAVGAFFAYRVAAMPQPSWEHYYWEMVLPGRVLGVIVGYATQRYGRAAAPVPAR